MTNEELDHIESLEQQLAQAQAQVASLRDALKPFNLNMGPRLDYLPFEVSVGAIRKAAEAYNSTSCGSGMIHVSELDAPWAFYAVVLAQNTWEIIDGKNRVVATVHDGDIASLITDAVNRLQSLRAKAK